MNVITTIGAEARPMTAITRAAAVRWRDAVSHRAKTTSAEINAKSRIKETMRKPMASGQLRVYAEARKPPVKNAFFCWSRLASTATAVRAASAVQAAHRWRRSTSGMHGRQLAALAAGPPQKADEFVFGEVNDAKELRAPHA